MAIHGRDSLRLDSQEGRTPRIESLECIAGVLINFIVMYWTYAMGSSVWRLQEREIKLQDSG